MDRLESVVTAGESDIEFEMEFVKLLIIEELKLVCE